MGGCVSRDVFGLETEVLPLGERVGKCSLPSFIVFGRKCRIAVISSLNVWWNPPGWPPGPRGFSPSRFLTADSVSGVVAGYGHISRYLFPRGWVCCGFEALAQLTEVADFMPAELLVPFPYPFGVIRVSSEAVCSVYTLPFTSSSFPLRVSCCKFPTLVDLAKHRLSVSLPSLSCSPGRLCCRAHIFVLF